MGLTLEQVQLVKATVPILREHGKDITTNFYKDLITDNPTLNNVFNRTNQANGHQAFALANALYAYASHIDDLGVLSPAVERICQKHASLYVQPEQYDIVGKYLLKAMKDVLGDALTQDIHTAWAVAYKQLANLMIGKEKQIYKKSEGWTDWREFTISDKAVESDEITSFYLKPQDGKPLPRYSPGQFVSIRTKVPALDHLQPRQYSLSDAPRRDYYRISVKKDVAIDMSHPTAPAHLGYVSNILHGDKHVGDSLQLSHPSGDFYLDPVPSDEKPIVLLSAGVGITPLLSILRTLDEQDSIQPISWIHGTRNSRVQAFTKDINEIAARRNNVRTAVFMSRPERGDVEGIGYQYAGRMNLELLNQQDDLFLHDRNAEYYICGPDRFMVDMKNSLLGYGVDSSRIKMEVFGVAVAP